MANVLPDPNNPPANSGTSTSTPTSSAAAGTTAAAAVSSPGLGQQLSGVGTYTFALICGTAGVQTQGPGRSVLPGETVEISPIPTNAGNAYTASTPEAAKNGPNRDYWLPTTQPRVVSVGRLNEIWMSANLNEGILIRIRPS
jgi:hypothetical protein